MRSAWCTAVLPAAELARSRHGGGARGSSGTPASLLALVKENLNQAEDELDRRRFLFANEAENQIQSSRDICERMPKAAKDGSS